jgi:hypothetical protein
MKIKELKQKLSSISKDTKVCVVYKNLNSNHLLDVDEVQSANGFKAIFLLTRENNNTKNSININKIKRRL